MKLFKLLLIISTLLFLNSCEEINDSIKKDIEGVWLSQCYFRNDGYTKEIITINSETYTDVINNYLNSNCLGDIQSTETLGGIYTTGNIITTISGLSATELNIYYSNSNADTIGIYYIDNDLLYLNLVFSTEPRPDSLSFTSYLTRAY